MSKEQTLGASKPHHNTKANQMLFASLRVTAYMIRSLTRSPESGSWHKGPSRVKPAFSRTRMEATFSVAQVASIRSRPIFERPCPAMVRSAFVVIPDPQCEGDKH
jgi:hypothetical protein